MQRRAVAVAATLGTITLLTSACGSSGGGNKANGTSASGSVNSPATSGSAASSSSKPGDVVNLSFWNAFTGPDRPGIEALIAQFNSSHPNIHVNADVMQGDVLGQKLLPAYAAGNGPDIAAVDTSTIPGYAQKGVIQPMDDVFSNGTLDKSVLVSSAVDAAQWNGKQYGVPMTFTTLMMYYNKTLFAQAGISSPPTTWDEWAKDAEALTKMGADGKPSQYGLVLPEHDTVPNYPILIWENGGSLVSSDGKTSTLGDPAAVQAVEYWANLVKTKHISPVGVSGAEADQLFQSGKAAMEITGPWATTGYAQAGVEFGLAMVPAGPVSQLTQGSSTTFALNAKDSGAKKAAAYEFFKFWDSKASQTYLAVHTGYPPDRTDVTAGDLSANPYVAAFAQYSSKSKFYLPGLTQASQIDGEIFVPSIEKILAGQGDAATVLKQAAQQINQTLGS